MRCAEHAALDDTAGALPGREPHGPRTGGEASGPRSRRRPASPSARVTPAAHRLDGLTVLVIEDHTDSREMLRQMMRSLGAVVHGAADGWEGLVLLRAERPDVILCDLLMPTMDGYAFIAALRRDAAWQRTPIVAVTALGSDADYRRTWEAGFDGHLTKPIQADQLTAVVHAVLRMRRPEPDPGT